MLLFLALALGLAAARLPMPTLALLLGSAIILLGTLIEPLFGLGVTLILAPFGALERIALPNLLPFDASHLLLGLVLAAWLGHKTIAQRTDGVEPGSHRLVASDYWLLAFLGIGALSLANALSLQYGLKELIKWGELGAVMLLVRERARERRPRIWIITALLAAGLLQAGIGIWEFAFRGIGPKEFLILGHYYRAYGTFEQPNPFAGFVGLLLPVALGLTLAGSGQWVKGRLAGRFGSKPGEPGPSNDHVETRRLGAIETLHVGPRASLMTACCLLLTIALTLAVIMSWSRGAWLAVLSALAAMLLFAPQRRAVGLSWLIGLLLAGWVAWQAHLLPASIVARLSGFSEYAQFYDVRGADITDANYAILDRLAHWQTALDMIRDHLWLGIGLGNYEPVYPAYARLNWPLALGHAHNIYLNYAAETGLIGLAAYLGFWATVIALTSRAVQQTHGLARGLALGLLGAWIHLSVHNLVDNLYVNGVYLHIGALLGLLTAIIYDEQATH